MFIVVIASMPLHKTLHHLWYDHKLLDTVTNACVNHDILENYSSNCLFTRVFCQPLKRSFSDTWCKYSALQLWIDFTHTLFQYFHLHIGIYIHLHICTSMQGCQVNYCTHIRFVLYTSPHVTHLDPSTRFSIFHTAGLIAFPWQTWVCDRYHSWLGQSRLASSSSR